MVLSDNDGLGCKLLVTGWALMECLLFGGLQFGWGSLSFVLKSEGIYADLCPQISQGNATEINETANEEAQTMECKPQDKRMVLCFTIAATLYTVGCVILGHVSYKWGTRVARILGFLIFTAGSLMMAFITKEHPWLMYPGVLCIAIGGITLLVTNMQVSNLFIKRGSTVVGLLNGGFDSSSVVMLLVKIASEKGFSRQNMFFLITGLHSLIVSVSTFFFLPKYFIKKRQSGSVPVDLPEVVEVKCQQDKEGKEEVKMLGTDMPSLRSCVCNPMFFTHIVWLCLLQLRFHYFIGTLNPYLGRILNGDEDKVSYFTNVCYYIMMGGVVTSFLSGAVHDWQRVILKDGKSDMYRKVLPAALPQGMTSLLAVILSIVVLIPNPNLLYIMSIVVTLMRSFLYSLAAAFIGDMFPAEYFAIMYGIMMVSGGLFGLLQYALFTWAESYAEGALHVDIFLLGMVCVSFLHPIYLWISSWREERKLRAN